MTQPTFITMLRECLPGIEELEMLLDHQYQELMATIPEDFLMDKDLLLDLCSIKKNARHVDWLASAVAAACQSNRHLWQDYLAVTKCLQYHKPFGLSLNFVDIRNAKLQVGIKLSLESLAER